MNKSTLAAVSTADLNQHTFFYYRFVYQECAYFGHDMAEKRNC